MFKQQLATEKGRQLKRSFYDTLMAHGCNQTNAIIAAEVLALETQDLSYQRTESDKKAIHDCWQKIIANNK